MKWFEKSLPILNPLLIFPSLSNASVINKFAFNETSSISQIELGRKREREILWTQDSITKILILWDAFSVVTTQTPNFHTAI